MIHWKNFCKSIIYAFGGLIVMPIGMAMLANYSEVIFVAVLVVMGVGLVASIIYSHMELDEDEDGPK